MTSTPAGPRARPTAGPGERRAGSRPAGGRRPWPARPRPALVAGLVVVVLAASAVLALELRGPGRPQGLLVPAKGALLGAYVSRTSAWEGHDQALADVAETERQLGRTLAIDQHYYNWKDTFPTDLERADLAAGRIPLISWQGTRLGSILDGSQDAVISARARDVAALHRQVFLRWNWEMNGDWSAGSGPRNNSPGATDGPAKYVAAWKHLRKLFRDNGATNAVWVWCPNATSAPTAAWNTPAAYYPGDDWVDWVGVDTYNWGATRPWSSWKHLVENVVPFQAAYGDRKPIMIAETASAQAAGDKARWIDRARTDLPQLAPSVAALVWFDVKKEEDWRIDSSPSALAALRRLAHDPYFEARP